MSADMSMPGALPHQVRETGGDTPLQPEAEPYGIEVIAPEADYGEAGLIQRLKSGDGRAYEEMIRNLGPRLMATAQRLLANEDDSKDAVQDAFVSAFRNIQNFDGKSKLSTWLHRIVINASLMKLRTKRRKPAVSIDGLLPKYRDDGHMETPIPNWRERAEAERADSETRASVRREIDELPDEYRTVIMLRDIEGLDTGETATVLEITESAVKTRLHRARQALRERLNGVMAVDEDGGMQ